MKYYNNSIEEVFNDLDTNMEGLKSKEAKKRLEKYGKNELPKAKEESIFKLFLSQFCDPMEIILVITVFLSFLVGETIDAIALIVIILVDTILGTYEEWKAKKDAKSLIDMIKVSCFVIRDNKRIEVNSSDVVVGDIIALESGMKICADARIIESYNFQVNESALTGESVAVSKNNKKLKNDTALADRINMVYAGTTVTTGRALAVVTSTATKTEIGKIASKVSETKEEKSPLTIRTERFSKQISCIILVVAIIVAFVLKSKDFPLNEIFLSVIALAVSAMPEGLSLALTMALTVASKRMLKKNVIVKKLNAVESLGSCTVIASDKTGTLTVNEQTLKEIVLSDGSKYKVTGTGYNGEGKVECINGSKIEKAQEFAFLGAINNEAVLEFKNNKWESFGDSIDIAFKALGEKLNISYDCEIVERIPYESENQYSAVFYKKDNKLFCTVKGSLEKVMSFSNEDESYIKENTLLTGNGYRVIAIANGEVKSTDINKVKLDFIGMAAFIDPIRVEVKNSLKECASAGIKVVMITGDHPLTAYAIGKELGLCQKYDEVATGKDVEYYKSLGDDKFDEYVKGIRVFSRVTPIDKLDIVNSYKRQKEFVAVTGDGVNDAPAIKAANIGIAMGSGTDVAKETASMIIKDDNFTSIVSGIKEGRTAYSNIRKITLFLLGCGFAEVAFFLLSIMFNYDIPMVAIQLLWLNMVTDGLQDIAISFEKSEDSIMKEKPRDTNESLFSKDLMIEVLILGITITVVVFGVWKYLMDNNYGLIFSRSVIMMLMVFIQNINVLNCRSEKKSVFKKKLFDNPFIVLIIFGSILLQIILAEVDITASFLKVEPISFGLIGLLLLLSCSIIVVFEIYKLIIKKKSK